MWVRFTSDFDFKPTPQATIAYKAGMVANVTRACATLAVAAGKADRLRKVGKADNPTSALTNVEDAVVDGALRRKVVGKPIYLKEADDAPEA